MSSSEEGRVDEYPQTRNVAKVELMILHLSHEQ